MYEENKYCPICEKIILDNDHDEDYVFCDYCNFCKAFVFLNCKSFFFFEGIHAICEKITKSGMKKIKDLEKYKCSLCKKKEE